MSTTATAVDTPRPSLPALVAIGSIITVSFLGSVIVTPLYPLYQAKFGFSDITLTLVYAVYVVGNVLALLVFGQVSDQLGRKRVAFPALVLAALAGLLFLVASGTVFLYLGRLLIGLAVGVASGTGTAWLAEELGPERRVVATLSSSTANLTGIALGPLIGGLLAQYGAWPLRLPFVVYIGLLAVVAIAISQVGESRQSSVRRIADVRIHPRIGVPRDLLGAFAAPGVSGFVTFAVGGLYFALIPGILIRDLHEPNLAVSGLIVFELATIGALLISLARALRPVVAMTTGLIALMPAVALIVIAQAARSMVLLVIATALAGITLALGYRGSLQIVNEIAPDERRGELVSSYFICCFVGNAVPVIGLGVLETVTDPLVGSIVFAATLGVFALAALVRSATRESG